MQLLKTGQSGLNSKKGNQKAVVTRYPGIVKFFELMTRSATEHSPVTVVTEYRLDKLVDAWMKIPCELGEEGRCKCVRCVTIDILQITHVIGESDLTEAITRVASCVNEIARNDKTWGIGTLQPGKSNFWLSGLLLKQSELTSQPLGIYITSVKDKQPWVKCPVTVYSDTETDPDFLIILDDMSYSGTQFNSLVNALCDCLPRTKVIGCPLFVTPHAQLLLSTIKNKNFQLWEDYQTAPKNSSMFQELGEHRHCSARSFDDLMTLYRTGWNDNDWFTDDKILTTCVPYFKIPDGYSCPQKAYLSNVGSMDSVPVEFRDEINRWRFKPDPDQNPAYKEILIPKDFTQ